jgi:hypothetical protein
LGEKAVSALLGEINEEIGENAFIKRFIGVVECNWMEADQDNHEINLVFKIDILNYNLSKSPESKESNLEFIGSHHENIKIRTYYPYQRSNALGVGIVFIMLYRVVDCLSLLHTAGTVWFQHAETGY